METGTVNAPAALPPHAASPADDGRGVPLLRLREVTKRFQSVVALRGVDFELRRGEVHAVCGENGAGKSTLMKIISGQLRSDEGRIEHDGRPVRYASTREAEAAGIAMIHQELNLVPHLSVAENLFLAREPRRGGVFIDWAALYANARECLAHLGADIDPKAIVRTLSVAQQQMVEIAKALSLNAQVLIMDEPTSSLTESETGQLFRVIRELKRKGAGIVYISHRLDELCHIVDRVTVLRDGQHVSTDDFAATTIDRIVVQMVGRNLDDKFPAPSRRPQADVLLSVQGLCRDDTFNDVGFELKRGEILGFAGLMGAGRTEVARAIFGADPLHAGRIELGGRPLHIRSPRDAIRHGIAYLSEDRKAYGLAVNMTVAHNVTMANTSAISNRFGFMRSAEEERVARQYVDTLAIRTPSVRQLVRLLSGGNQQKVVIAKWLFRDARVLFFDEPTRGIDVGAKYAIYQLLDELAARGIGIVLISSELPEILGMTDRVAVFHSGRLTAVLNTRETSQHEVMQYASGVARMH